ncbi:hypothetical protein J2783_000544 [Chryseobacterium sediminis]|nr:hypothetical protein [Chryseobacterium sediminis]
MQFIVMLGWYSFNELILMYIFLLIKVFYVENSAL